MSLKEIILDLLKYNHWANQRVLTNIDESIVDTEVVSSFSSIRKTVYHSWDAETVWFERMQQVSVTPWPASGNFKGTFTEAVVEILKQEEKILAYINAADESFFTAELHYKNLKGLEFSNTNFQVLQHMVNHSTMHRGQIITQMRQLGVQSILSTDLIAYYREKNQ